MNQELFKVECLTPIHIGSGKELIRDLDFYRVDGATEVLDPELMLERFGGLEAFADGIRRGIGIGEFLKGRGMDASPCRLYRVEGTIEAQRLRMAIRSGDGRPIIFGSSIKGAMRTLLLAAWSTGGGPHEGNRNAAVTEAIGRARRGRFGGQEVEEVLFHFAAKGLRAGDPRTDLLRTLSVSDATFAPATLKILSSRAIGTERNTLTAAEAIERGSCALAALTLDNEFLAGHLPFPNRVPDFATLAGWSYQHARHLIEPDLKFFRDRHERGVVERLEQLKQDIHRTAEGAIVLRLGWGTGWRTMTGDILRDDERTRLVGRVGKTRKVIIEGHTLRGRGSDVFGWIRIEPISAADAAHIAKANAFVPVPKMPQAAVPAQAVTSTPVLPQDWFAQTIQGLKASDWGKVRGLVQQASSTGDSAQREHRLKLLAEQLVKTFGRDKARMRDIAGIAELAPYLKKK